ncbi:MAG: T9SS type A sorting domain-containing protein [Ignavibacteria bacterium]|nr:T9SS type A sorting domain-containing protein [Ignavibacteria bacterium]
MKFKFFSYIIAVCILAYNINPAFSQYDDPNIDQPPQQYWDYVATVIPRAPAVITDNSGYDNFDIGTAFAEVHNSMNPRNPLQTVAAWNTTSGANFYYTNNGIDWTQAAQPSWGQTMRGDPVTAYDSLGNVYFDNMYGASILGTRTAKSSNNGVSWSSVAFGNIGNDKNWIACDQTGGPYANSVYGVMTPGNFVRSTDFGASFQNTFSSNNTLPGMMVCVGANGNVSGGCVYVVTNQGSSFSPVWTFFRSTDGGTTFQQMSQVVFANYVGTNVGGRNSVENMRTRPYPFITADNSFGPNRGRLYLVYASNFPAGDGNKPDIFFRYSTDQGANWSAETKINDDVNTQNNNQWFPAIWCDKQNGNFYVHWMDTRDCPTSDSALIYASMSTNGGASFFPNSQISNKKFKINCTTCGGGGTPAYLGDYNSVASNSVTSVLAWTDFRSGGFGNFVAYYPDYAMKTSTNYINVNNGSSGTFKVVVPSVKAYNSRVKFTLSMDTLPASGTLALSFIGKDSLTSYPDSVTVNVTASGSVTPGRYSVKITGSGPNGTPVHRRYVSVLVNSSFLNIGTNRPGIAEFKVNGVSYTSQQQFVFTNGASVTVQAVSPRIVGVTRYVYTNWSNGGDTTQTFNINSNTDLTAFYKVQYRLLVNSSQGTTFGGNNYYDSASNATFGVNSRIVNNGGTNYYFRGWTGVGNGSYTSTDSTGLDSAVTVTMNNVITETAIWTTTVGINQLSAELPSSYSLMQNYPNPFNPTTNIKFDIVKSGNVKVSVYNSLGKTVQVLLNENIQPGSYEVSFDASGLSSGIYFYTIETAGFTQTKRMILLK